MPCKSSVSFDIFQIRIDIGIGRYITLSQLRPEDVESLQETIEEWYSITGSDINQNIVLKFN